MGTSLKKTVDRHDEEIFGTSNSPGIKANSAKALSNTLVMQAQIDSKILPEIDDYKANKEGYKASVNVCKDYENTKAGMNGALKTLYIGIAIFSLLNGCILFFSKINNDNNTERITAAVVGIENYLKNTEGKGNHNDKVPGISKRSR